MPTYDYKCSECENIQEEFHGISQEPEIICEKCGSRCKMKFVGNTNFILKGDGWPSQESRIKQDLTNKNKKASVKTKEKEKAGEAVKNLGDLKKHV